MIQVTFQKEDFKNKRGILWEYIPMIYEKTFPKETEKLYVKLARSIKNYQVARDMETTRAFPKYVQDFLKRKELAILDAQNEKNQILQVGKFEREYQNIQKESLDFFETMSHEDIASKEYHQIDQTMKAVSELQEEQKISEVPKRNQQIISAIDHLVLSDEKKAGLLKLWFSYLEMRILSFQIVEQFAKEILLQNSIKPGFEDCPTYEKSIHACNALDEYGMSGAFLEDLSMLVEEDPKAYSYTNQDSEMMMKISDYLAKGQMDWDLSSFSKSSSPFCRNVMREFSDPYLFLDSKKHLK